MIYRREIDGLRALAVLPVIFFHVGIGYFSGGYVGVDIFFVISGYLITTIIINEIEKGSFTLLKFYERRARRILPALFFVILCSIPIAYLVMTPHEMLGFGKSIIAVSIFLSNVLFWQQAGYFETSAEEMPLLHTWSLAVEEQYYLLFPLFLVFLWRAGKKEVFFLIILAALISLVLSEWGSSHAPVPNFYLAPTRAWELLAGSICGFIAVKEGFDLKKRNLLSILGLGLIFFAIFAYDDLTPFPSLYALAPVVGSCLIILFSQNTWVGKLLSLPIFVGVGLISYSLYLWHQPILAYTRLIGVDISETWQIMLFLCVVLGLAFLTWKFIENPFRNKKAYSQKYIYTFSCLGILFFCSIGFYAYQEDGLPSRFSSETLALIAPVGSEYACSRELEKTIEGAMTCSFGDEYGVKTVLLLGDSHADAFSAGLDPLFQRSSIKGVRLSSDLCHPLPNIYDTRYVHINECEEIHKKTLEYIGKNIDAIILHVRWTFRLYPISGQIDELNFDNMEGGVERKNPPRNNFVLIDGEKALDAKAKEEAIVDYIELLSSVSLPILVVGPVPEPGWHIPKYNMQLNLRGEALEEISSSYKVFKERNAFILSVLKKIEQTNLLEVGYPHQTLCDLPKGRCFAQKGSVPFYFDDDHLSLSGVEVVLPSIIDPFFEKYDLKLF